MVGTEEAGIDGFVEGPGLKAGRAAGMKAGGRLGAGTLTGSDSTLAEMGSAEIGSAERGGIDAGFSADTALGGVSSIGDEGMGVATGAEGAASVEGVAFAEEAELDGGGKRGRRRLPLRLGRLERRGHRDRRRDLG